MANHYLLLLSDASTPAAPWETQLASRGIVLLKTSDPGQIRAYGRAYPLMMVVLRMDVECAQAAEWVNAVRETCPAEACGPFILALLPTRAAAGVPDQLARCGVDGLGYEDAPDHFLLCQIDLLRRLNDLQAFEKRKLEVNDLAHRTRESLHDLSQPLSAIHGRIQLLAARCDENDPNADCFKELVRLTFDLTQQVMEMQQFNRQYS